MKVTSWKWPFSGHRGSTEHIERQISITIGRYTFVLTIMRLFVYGK